MKRSELTRSVPLRRTALPAGAPPKRRRSHYPGSRLLAERRDWARSQPPVCMLCGRGAPWPGLQVHEICRRSQAPGRWAHACNYMLLCGICHAERVANITDAPYAAQLAVKLLRDPESYDFELFLEVVGRPAVTPEEVELCFRTLFLAGMR